MATIQSYTSLIRGQSNVKPGNKSLYSRTKTTQTERNMREGAANYDLMSVFGVVVALTDTSTKGK